jgi:hypothetical protein
MTDSRFFPIDFLKKGLQALQRAKLPCPHGAFADAENCGDLRGTEMLQKSEYQDLAICLRQPQKSRSNVVTVLAMRNNFAWRGRTTWKLLRQLAQGLIRQQQSLGLLSMHAAALRGEVMFVEPLEPFSGNLSQPGVEGNGAFNQVLRQLLCGFDQGFLDHIRRVDAGGQTTIEADLDHLTQPVPVPEQQTSKRIILPLRYFFQQVLRVRFIGVAWHP